MVAGLPPVDLPSDGVAPTAAEAGNHTDKPSPGSISVATAAWILLAFLALSLTLNYVVLQKLPGVSPVDGIVYADAMDRALDGGVTVKGDTMGDATSEYVGCRGVHGWGDFGVPCGGPYPDLLKGYTTAYVHPPTYFFATAGLVKVAQLVLPDAYPFDLARMAGAVWFSLGALVMVVLAVRWGARPWSAAIVVAALMPTPTFVTMFSFITPDTMSLLVCAGMALGVTLWWQDRLPAWTLLFFGLLAAAVKQTYFLAAIACLLLIGVLWWKQRSKSGRQSLVAAAWFAAGAVGGIVAWDVIKSLIAAKDTIPAGVDLLAFPVNFDGVFGLIFTGARDLPVDAAGTLIAMPAASRGMAAGLVLALAAAAGGALLYRSSRSDEFALSAAGMTSIAVGGLILSSMYFVTSGIFLPPAMRYVMGAFPLYAVPLMLAMKSRVLWSLVLAAAVVGFVAWFLFPVTPAIQ